MKNAKKILVKITTQKISEKETLKMYSDLITLEITALEKSKGKGKDRTNNILNVLNNLESVFTGAYLHYKNVSKETKFERSITENKIKKRKIG